MKFTYLAVEVIPFYPWVSLHHTFAVRNLILRCLTGSHMTILSKSNYRVRLDVNMELADSFPIYFNFGKGYHFVLRQNNTSSTKPKFFLMNIVNPAIVDWGEKEVETCARRLLSFESFLGKTKSIQQLLFHEHYDCIKHCEGTVASWLVRSNPDRVVRVRALAGVIVLCS